MSHVLTPLDNRWYSRTDSGTVFVFVHGLFAESRTCWLYQSRHAQQPDVFWPDLVAKDSRFGNPSIFLAGYETDIHSGEFSITECAQQVHQALSRPQREESPAVLSYTRIVFICHSAGGVIVRYLLERHQKSFADKSVGLALIASPALGSGWANLAAAISAQYHRQRLGLQLRLGSTDLMDLHSRFRDLVDQRAALMPGLFGMEAAEHRTFFLKYVPSWFRWLLPLKWKIVTTLSAGQYFGAVTVLPGTDHFSAVKPDGPQHPAHDFLVTFTTRFNQIRVPPEASNQQGPLSPDRAAARLEVSVPWPIASKIDKRFGFLAQSGFDDSEGVAVVAYIAVEDLDAMEQRFSVSVDSMLQDPYFHSLPGVVSALQERRIKYGTTDEDARNHIVEAIAGLIFEAYVCFTRIANSPQRQSYDEMTTALLFQRLRSGGHEPVILSLASGSRNSVKALEHVVQVTAARIRRTDQREIEVTVRRGDATETGCLVAEWICEIVRRRLETPETLQARHFLRIHPTKLRLMQDFREKQFYSRRRPFGSKRSGLTA